MAKNKSYKTKTNRISSQAELQQHLRNHGLGMEQAWEQHKSCQTADCDNRKRYIVQFVGYCRVHRRQSSLCNMSQLSFGGMNDFPVIGDLVMRTGLWDRQGANIALKWLQRNVWRGAVSLFKSSVFGQRMLHFAVIL